jgi:hypothetical protein
MPANCNLSPTALPLNAAKSSPCAVRLCAVARREGSALLPDTRAQATTLLCLPPMHRRLYTTFTSEG